MLTGKEVDASTPSKKITDHLAGNFFGRKAYTFINDSVIGCKYNTVWLMQFRMKCLLNQPDLSGDIF